MEGGLRETAILHAPFFVTAPGETDILFTMVVWFVVLAVFGLGALYLSLHSLPERMAHHANHTQIQLISILTLLALFTHNNLFWLAALVIAVVQVPDFYSPIQSIADSVKAMARKKGVIDDSDGSSNSVTQAVTQEASKDV
ncbi:MULTISPECIES: hypothetical protein [Thalassospira]|uniref:Uncharacterized protein n=1 Tax=Thalassospira profundimaris TaxID=502049 RepID=A0A367V4H0_9PROT|nr:MULTISPECIES: hypothetical protein [Thalassospira]KZB70535.1 hypothetical protein AUQ43_06530 [Thalassospira sp. MCCC 1A01148]RCK19919.1 hypothetical protein TH6_18100 [Thalassospira profundimaris]